MWYVCVFGGEGECMSDLYADKDGGIGEKKVHWCLDALTRKGVGVVALSLLIQIDRSNHPVLAPYPGLDPMQSPV